MQVKGMQSKSIFPPTKSGELWKHSIPLTCETQPEIV